MPDQNDLLKAIRVIVREENQEIKDDMHEVKQRLGTLEQKVDNLEQKVEELPEKMIELIAEPLVKEDEFQAKRLDRLEKHNHLSPLSRAG